jgi:hypothetical protein
VGRQARQVYPVSREVVYALFGRPDSGSFEHDPASHGITNGIAAVPSSVPKSVEPNVDPTAELARCFLRLANLPNYALDRLSRYEATLWRQTGQILFALDALDRRKTQDRRRRFRLGIDLPAYGPRNVDLRALRSSHQGPVPMPIDNQGAATLR